MNRSSRQKTFFVLLCMLAITGYGFFVYAAAPAGGYNPGDTLNPDCAPGDVDCIVKPPITTGDNGLTVTGSNVQLGGELLQSTEIKQNGNDFFFTDGNVGVGTSAPQFTLDVGGTSQYAFSGTSFSGTLDDLSVDTNGYFGTTSITYTLYVSDISGPDEISWNDDRGNSGRFQLFGPSYPLSYGVIATFANLSGHAGDENWTFTITKTSGGILNVADQINVGGNFFATQNKNYSTFIGTGVEVLNNISSALFIGNGTGFNATAADFSNFIGYGTGSNAVSASVSNFIGYLAGIDATYAYGSNFMGYYAGGSSANAHDANFLGSYAGYSINDGSYSNFIGYNTGYKADSVNNSNFIGSYAGSHAEGSSNANFFGTNAGDSAVNSYNSNFIGYGAGQKAKFDVSAHDANFIGSFAGQDATNANHSIFIGTNAGDQAINASNSIFLGFQAGYHDTVDNYNTGNWSILIGDNTSTGGFGGSIAIGQGAINTIENQFLLARQIEYMNLRGVNYHLPQTDGGSGDVLTTDGAGELVWAAPGALSVGITNGLEFISGDIGLGGVLSQNTKIDGNSNAYAVTFDSLNAFTVNTDGSISLQTTNDKLVLGWNGINTMQVSSSGVLFGVQDNTSISMNFGATNSDLQINTDPGTAGQVLTSSGPGLAPTWTTISGGGAGLQWYAENAAAPALAPVATGDRSIALGDSAEALSKDMFIYGEFSGTAATNADNSIFIGKSSGSNATNAFNSNFLGENSGTSATDANYSNFFGQNAGNGAVYASRSSFFGANSGYNAQNAANSIFLGTDSGSGDTVDNTAIFDDLTTFANTSILIGHKTSTGGFRNSIALGAYAINTAANQLQIGSTNRPISSVFIGDNKGTASTNGTFFVGVSAGYNATSAARSVFIGQLSGSNATSAAQSNFIGFTAGRNATNASSSNFFGSGAGDGAVDAAASNFLGLRAGLGAIEASQSNFLGREAGYQALYANDSNFFGRDSGKGATYADSSNFFLGGKDAVYANSSNFFGVNAGQSAAHANDSNFFGSTAGYIADYAAYSNFFGTGAGGNAVYANNSNFFGNLAGSGATSGNNSTFIGQNAGRYNSFTNLGTPNAANSIFIGTNAGYFNADGGLNNTTNPDDYSILLGNNTSTGGYENSIALGAYATNTASSQFMIGSTTRPIDVTRINGSASTQCTITTGTGIACTSDERLKTNINDLTSDTLYKLLNVKTVTYNWLQNPTSKTQIGFLAQDLEQYFPELVDTDTAGMKSVYYAQMTPILVEAIREMNLKITDINNTDAPNSWRDALVAWFGNINNGIGDFFANRAHVKELCIGDSGNETCLSKSQVDKIIQATDATPTVYYPVGPTPDPSTPPVLDDTPPPDDSIPQTGDDTNTTESTPPPSVEPTPPVTE